MLGFAVLTFPVLTVMCWRPCIGEQVKMQLKQVTSAETVIL